MMALAVWLVVLGTAIGQEQVTLSGYLRDSTSGEALVAANVYVEELGTGAATNLYGFYSLSLPPGAYTVAFSYLGFQSRRREIDLQANTTLNVELPPEGLQIEEVIVRAEAANSNVTDVAMSVEKLSVPTIKLMPQVLGEVDLVRSLLLLPGVTTVGEGANGFNVRGGSVDQNLILLDEATVYNSSHLFGLFSVFNADAVKDVQLYKGGIPARYGGRLSSVLDVRQREGNNKQFEMSGGIGLISSRLTLEGPIQKDRSSFIVSGRSSYGHLFLNFVPDLADNVAYFYDLNAKVNFELNDRNRIFLSGYFGKDVFNFGDDFSSNWGNTTGTFRWNHLFNDKLFSNLSLVASDYGYSFGVPEGNPNSFDWNARIISYKIKSDFSYFLNPGLQLDFGVNATFYRFHPGEARGLGDDSFFNEIVVPNKHAVEPAAYISLEQKVSDRLTLQYGLRFAAFLNTGSGVVYQYEDGVPTSEEAIIDTSFYDSWELIEGFSGLEPRFAANYILSDEHSVKLSYNRMQQFIHLVSNTTSPTPIDIWTPSGPYIKPAIVDQVAVGYFRNFADNKYEASVEAYYKHFDNLLDFKDGAELILNETLETELLQGQGRAYGLELIVRKTQGRFTGWVSYTLARSERQIEGINRGEYYPSNYDKLHDLSVVGSWAINPKLTLSGNFAFMTGRPITYPDARYNFEGIVVPRYGNRNGARTPAYHRFDLALNWKPGKHPERRWKGEWVFGVYNIYGRRNPYSIFFRQNEDNPLQTEAVRLSIFGAPLPYVTYNFTF